MEFILKRETLVRQLPSMVADYPFKSRYLDLPDGRIHYVDEGRGSPVVFVHGTPSWSYEYRALIRDLRGSHRCVAMDHLGFGLSQRPWGADYSLKAHAERFESFVESRGFEEPFYLVVHDFGGPIALPYLLKNPQKVRGLVVMNSWFWPLEEADPAFVKQKRWIASPFMKMLYLRFNFSARKMVPMSWGSHRPISLRDRKNFRALFPNRESRIGAWRFAETLAQQSDYFAQYTDRLGILRDLPSFVIWGKSDRAIGEAHLKKWKELLQNRKLLELRDVGHFPQIEAPEKILAPLSAFFER